MHKKSRQLYTSLNNVNKLLNNQQNNFTWNEKLNNQVQFQNLSV